MNILIIHQSVTDTFAALLTLMTALVDVDGTRMSFDSGYDQFVCRMWLTRNPLWVFLSTSTYGIFLMTLERYLSITYPIWYHNNVRTTCMSSVTLLRAPSTVPDRHCE